MHGLRALMRIFIKTVSVGRISMDREKRGIELLNDLNVMKEGLVFEKERTSLIARFVSVGSSSARSAGKLEKVLDDLFAPARLLDDPTRSARFGSLSGRSPSSSWSR